MISFINVLLKYQFLQKSLLICVLTSICCGILGTYIVYRRMVFLTSSISHASFGGIGIGIYLIYYFNLNINPLIFAIVFAGLSGALILYIQKEMLIETDTVIGIIMSFGMAIGILFMYITPGYQKDLSTYLFGNILLGSYFNIKLLFFLNILIVILFIVFNKAIKYLSFDENYYELLGVPTNFIDYILIIIVSIAIIVNIKSIGIVLILSILTIPQSIAALLSNSYNKICILAIFISLISMLLGLLISYLYRIPSGPSIVLILVILFILTTVLTKLKNIIKL